jgi:crossover junction endodeoxyribonuclease RuvC
MIKTIGIDPGLAGTGIGIIKGSGVTVNGFAYSSISTSKTDSLPNRLDKIHSTLLQVLKQEQPDCMVVEAVFSLSKYPKSAITLGQVSGIILLASHQVNITVSEVSVRETKQILTGNGNASKQQLEMAIRRQLNVDKPIRPYHASDALGLALIGFFRYKHLQAVI